MLLTPTAVAGAFVVDLEAQEDERGFFARSWCAREFAAAGLDARLVQCNVSWTRARGTLRGLHWQAAPHQEAKLVRCSRGAMWDVVIDVRPDSPTFRRYAGYELNADNRRALYIPAGCAHGFQTLADDTETFYQMSEFHAPDAQRGARWDDRAFGIAWPVTPPDLNRRDREFPDFTW